MPPRPNPQRRLELALAAFEVLRSRGAQRVTMRELADALGLKRPTLYWYFPDLGAVFDAVLAHVLTRQRAYVAERMRSAVGERLHPVDLIRAYGEATLGFFAASARFGAPDAAPADGATGGSIFVALMQFWAVSEAGEPNRALAAFNAHFVPLRAAAVALLGRGIADGEVRACDPAAVVDTVAAVIDGCLLHQVTRGLDPGPVWRLVWETLLAPLVAASAADAARAR